MTINRAYLGQTTGLTNFASGLTKLQNLFLVGHNGIHRYNNQDHSMLTAMTAVENIIASPSDKANIGT